MFCPCKATGSRDQHRLEKTPPGGPKTPQKLSKSSKSVIFRDIFCPCKATGSRDQNRLEKNTPQGPKGVLAGPGTPRDPKSYLFITKWVTILPFWKSLAGLCAEFRRGTRQIGPTPSISTFFRPFVDPQTAQKLKKCYFS